ncbi:hypothetical protein, partial [Sulfitobacter geojensis]|uniref:hypothetical protein n=1 Tax=Sulfitobacter geojensis TaxID=1342299 RepID=UPI001EEF4CF6
TNRSLQRRTNEAEIAETVATTLENPQSPFSSCIDEMRRPGMLVLQYYAFPNGRCGIEKSTACVLADGMSVCVSQSRLIR